MAKNTALKICDATIYPGETVSLALPLPELFTCAPVYMPIKVIHGKQSGPTLLVIAAMHGDEVNGTEIINRLLKLPSLKKLKGTLIAVPVLNVYGLLNRSRYLPNGHLLDRYFPGNKTGSHASRLCYWFIQEVFKHADVCIDLQTGSRNHSNFPQVYVNFDDQQSLDLAKTFNAPVITNVQTEKGSLRQYANKCKTPLLVYEAGEAMRFDERAIKVGLKGITSIMRSLKMLDTPKLKPKRSFKAIRATQRVWVRASTSGIALAKVALGEQVKKNQTLAVISDPFGASDAEAVKAPDAGVIVSYNNLPLVHEGEAIFQLAMFKELDKAASQLEAWHEHHTDNEQTS